MAAVRPSRYVTLTNSAEALPLEFVIEDFFSERAYDNASTIADYRYDLRYLILFLASVHNTRPERVMFAELTESALSAFKSERLLIESIATVRRRLAAIKVFCHFAAEKYGVADRAEHVSLPPLPMHDQFRSLTELQFKGVSALLPTLSVRDRFVMELLLNTGMRVGGVQNLLIRQVSPDWRFLKGVREKGAKYRDIPISAELRKAFVRYLPWRRQANYRPHLPVLVCDPLDLGPVPHEYVMSQKTVWRIVHAACRQAGIPAELAHPHTLRHTFARRFLANASEKLGAGRALALLSKLLGHTDIRTTMRYLTEDADEAYAVMQDFA